jgi:hypothetical protein
VDTSFDSPPARSELVPVKALPIPVVHISSRLPLVGAAVDVYSGRLGGRICAGVFISKGGGPQRCGVFHQDRGGGCVACSLRVSGQVRLDFLEPLFIVGDHVYLPPSTLVGGLGRDMHICRPIMIQRRKFAPKLCKVAWK